MNFAEGQHYSKGLEGGEIQPVLLIYCRFLLKLVCFFNVCNIVYFANMKQFFAILLSNGAAQSSLTKNSWDFPGGRFFEEGMAKCR